MINSSAKLTIFVTFNNKILSDMRFTSTFKNFKTSLLALGSILMLSSCGSYQYAGYDNDGIYNSDEVVVDVEEAATNRTSNNYYANYFDDVVTDAELAQEQSDDIFTDIDSYSSGNASGGEVEIIEDYGGWGQVNDQVTINFYNNGWNNWGWGWNDPWLWNGGFGWGWNNYWGYGWNRWNRWGYGFGWGWNDPWLWNGGFGYGWNNWGWHNNWRWNNRYYRNDLAFNRNRRGFSNRTAYASAGRNSISRRANEISRRIRTSRDGNGTVRTRNRSNVNTTRPSRGTITRPSRGTVTRPSRGNTTRPSRGTVTRPSRGNTARPSRGNTTRPSRGNTTRPSRGTYSPSRGSSRSSGTIRSGGGSRSSGSSRGGSSRGGRRG